MISLQEFFVLAGMFVLRIGIPIGVVAVLAYLLKRLDRRWEAEARAKQPAVSVQPSKPVKAPSAGRSGVDIPGQQLPFDPGLRLPQPVLAATPARPCWEIKGCSEATRAQCTAFQNPDIPCWQARLEAEGQMPKACIDCEVYRSYPRS